jgi:hypothetical protein
MGIGRLGGTLDFKLPRQEGESWCWAACASAVSVYFDPTSVWTQCAVAGATLETPECCGNPTACDHPSYVYRALEATGNFAARFAGPISRDLVIQELKGGRPVVARIQYPDIGHFVVIDGYRVTGSLRVLDPADESKRNLAFAALERRYNRRGAWSHTYFTRGAK